MTTPARKPASPAKERRALVRLIAVYHLAKAALLAGLALVLPVAFHIVCHEENPPVACAIGVRTQKIKQLSLS